MGRLVLRAIPDMMTLHEWNGSLTYYRPDGWLVVGDLRGLVKELGVIALMNPVEYC